MHVVVGLIIAILIIGTIAAVLWWNISARAAPYADESHKHRAKREREARERRESTVVIGPLTRDSDRKMP